MSGAIEWSRYARSYDTLAINNPSYRENLETVLGLFLGLGLKEGAKVCDVGAGTGNFLEKLAPRAPGVSFVHLDSSYEMNAVARTKYDSFGLGNVQVIEASIFDYEAECSSFDALICINALYAMNPQLAALKRMRAWLKPDGKLLIIDFGRQSSVIDWGRFILQSTLKEKGFVAGLELVFKGFGSIIQNRKGAQGQGKGRYWLHSTEEFGALLEDAGFDVELLDTCYRGYCDLAVCSKHPTPSP
ncbi:MAG: class I SAM-dependent methyltransferase [Gammaproteobacteria bacterium]